MHVTSRPALVVCASLALTVALAQLAACSAPSIVTRPTGSPTLDGVDVRGLSFARVVVFGDSLSDLGALKVASLGLAPNSVFYEGRFSNGRVWAELFADALRVPVESWAQGGAKAAGDQAIPLAVAKQAESYLGREGGKAPRDTLFVVWAGANDYFQGEEDPRPVVDGLVAPVRALLEKGARNLLVMETLRLSDLPPDGESQGANDAALDRIVAGHNERLRAAIEALRVEHAAARIALGSPQRLRDDVKDNPADFGITDVRLPCYGKGVFAWDGGARDRCADASKFFYLDAVHPTTRVHCAFAVSALEALVEVGMLASPIDEGAARARCQVAPAAF